MERQGGGEGETWLASGLSSMYAHQHTNAPTELCNVAEEISWQSLTLAAWSLFWSLQKYVRGVVN